MVGRQLEKLKKDKNDLMNRIRAVKGRVKAAKSRSRSSSLEGLKSARSEKLVKSNRSGSNGDSGDFAMMKEHLADLLAEMPAEEPEQDQKNPESKSLWDFWNTMKSILSGGGRRKRSAPLGSCYDVQAFKQNTFLLAMSYVDFWLTAGSLNNFGKSGDNCLQLEFCEIAAENSKFLHDSENLRAVVKVLGRGAGFYFSSGESQRQELDHAWDHGFEGSDCSIYKCKM